MFEQERARVVPGNAYGEGKGVQATGVKVDGEQDAVQLDCGLIKRVHARPHKMRLQPRSRSESL